MTAPPATGLSTKGSVPAILVAYVNAYGRNLKEVTAERVGAYEKQLNGMSPFTRGPTLTELERAKVFMTGLSKVVVFRATEKTQFAFLKTHPGISATAARDDNNRVRLRGVLPERRHDMPVRSRRRRVQVRW